MLISPKTVLLKNRCPAIIRTAIPKEGESVLGMLCTCAAQSHYLLRYPDEYPADPAAEQRYIAEANASPAELFVIAEAEGQIVGSAQLSVHTKRKTMHRADISLCILQAYQHLGLGTAFLDVLISHARTLPIVQLELEVIEGNSAAISLYEKLGFTRIAVRPRSIQLADGTYLAEYIYILSLK